MTITSSSEYFISHGGWDCWLVWCHCLRESCGPPRTMSYHRIRMKLERIVDRKEEETLTLTYREKCTRVGQVRRLSGVQEFCGPLL